MGKNRTADRTKGHLKAAASSSASTLEISASQQAFEDFNSFSSSGSSSLTPDLPPSIGVALKKLSKRDYLTKNKALEEINEELFGNNIVSESVYIAILPLWVRYYTKLCTEPNNRTRLLVNTVHAKLVRHWRKRISPFLKDVLGPWLSSAFDSEPEISKLAMAAFEDLFSGKVADVLRFGLTSLIAHLTEIATANTPETFADPRFYTPEEQRIKFQKASCGALNAVSFAVGTCHATTIIRGIGSINNYTKEKIPADCTTGLIPIVSSESFWEKLHQDDALIRNSLYNFIRVVTNNLPDVLNAPPVDGLVKKYFANSCFKERSPVTHSNLWASALLSMKKLPHLWAEKAISIDILEFISNAGYGSIASTYPSLVLLLANYPLVSEEFYANFFYAFWSGLSHQSIVESNSSKFITAYVECLGFLVQKHSVSIEITKYYMERLWNICTDPYTILVDPLLKVDFKCLVTSAVDFERKMSWSRIDGLICLERATTTATDEKNAKKVKHIYRIAPMLFEGFRSIKINADILISQADTICSLVIEEIIPECALELLQMLEYFLRSKLISKPIIQRVQLFIQSNIESLVFAATPSFLASIILMTIIDELKTVDVMVEKCLEQNSAASLQLVAIIVKHTGRISDQLLRKTIEFINNGSDKGCDLIVAVIESGNNRAKLAVEAMVNSLSTFAGIDFRHGTLPIAANFTEFAAGVVSKTDLPKFWMRKDLCREKFVSFLAYMKGIRVEHITFDSVWFQISNMADDGDFDREILFNEMKSVYSGWPISSYEAIARAFEVVIWNFVKGDFTEILHAHFRDFIELMEPPIIASPDLKIVDPIFKLTDEIRSGSIMQELPKEPLILASLINFFLTNSKYESSSIYSSRIWFKMLLWWQYFSDLIAMGLVTAELAEPLSHFRDIFQNCIRLVCGRQERAFILFDLAPTEQPHLLIQNLIKNLDNSKDYSSQRILRSFLVLLKGSIDLQTIENNLHSRLIIGILNSGLSLANLNAVDNVVATWFSDSNFDSNKGNLDSSPKNIPLSAIRRHIVLGLCEIIVAGHIICREENQLHEILPVAQKHHSAVLQVLSKLAFETLDEYGVILLLKIFLVLSDSYSEEYLDTFTSFCSFLERSKTFQSAYCNFWLIRVFTRPEEFPGHGFIVSTIYQQLTTIKRLQLSGASRQLYLLVLSQSSTLWMSEIAKYRWGNILCAFSAGHDRLSCSAYLICRYAIKVGFNPQNEGKPGEIIQELLDLICDHSQPTSALLFGWMLVLDYFEFSRPDVTSDYHQQLKSIGTDKTVGRMMTVVGDLLNWVSSDRTPPLDISKWDQSYFCVDEIESLFSALPLLAAHIYWRALILMPSIIRSWFLDLKDKPLINAARSYTLKHYSPQIIERELECFTDYSKTGDGKMKISINCSSSSKAVIASYFVDDNILEICLKIPNDFPLHQVDVEGLKRVGVSEQRWRRWMLNCATNFASDRGGNILDILQNWQSNVENHFEGIEDCSICYSIIGLLDRSVPTKQCKTCKQKFHGACLLKWFKSSSNNPTCPLCRSPFG